MSSYALYDRASKEAAGICNAAWLAAGQAYDCTMELINKSLQAEKIDQSTYTRLMTKADRKRDAAYQKANRVYDIAMRQAWKEHIVGEVTTQIETRQLALW
jgi:hypothetical protein